jgi:hypothetical protein
LEDLLSNPAVQGGVAPFLAGLVVALALAPFRLGGLSVLAAFLTCTYFVSGLQLTPLTSMRKLLILAIAAPGIGILADFAFKPTRIGAALLASVAAAAALWMLWPVISTKPAQEAWLLAGTTAIATAFAVGFAQSQLSSDGVRAGAAGLAMGLGVGIAAIFAASAVIGLQGIALGAGAGAYLLPQMIGGKKNFAGATLTLTAMLPSSLLAAAAMVLAQLPWYSVLTLAAVPAAARLPVPQRAPVWLQALLCSLYSFVVAGVACALAWPGRL